MWFGRSPDGKERRPGERLTTFEGTLQADGYAGFDTLYATDRVREAPFCTHARFGIFEIAQDRPDVDGKGSLGSRRWRSATSSSVERR